MHRVHNIQHKFTYIAFFLKPKKINIRKQEGSKSASRSVTSISVNTKYRDAVCKQCSEREKGAVGEVEVAPAPFGGARVRVWDVPPGLASDASPPQAAPLPCSAWAGLPGPPPLSCREGDALRRGGSSNVTASVHKLKLPGLVLSLFPHFPIFPIAGSRDGTVFCLSDHFSPKTPRNADRAAMQVPRVASEAH